MRRCILLAVVILSVLVAALALAGCGESDSEQAQDAVCEARAGIRSSVENLRALTPATVTVDEVQGNLESIQSDLTTIVENQAELAGDRRTEVETATAQFRLQLETIAKNLGTGLSLQEARQKFRASVASLNSAFESSLQPIDCG
jgi:hypothetical protein